MPDPELRNAVLLELAKLRHELADVTDRHKPALGPPDFVDRYTTQLVDRIAQLQRELDERDHLPSNDSFASKQRDHKN